MKCLSCGKQFDYEKYYGICPKCGTYNKPATTQTSEEQVTFDSHQTADANMQTQTTQEQTTYGGAQSPCQEEQQPYEGYGNHVRKKPSTAFFVLLVLSVIGIVLIVMLSIGYGFLERYMANFDYWQEDSVEVTEADVTDGEMNVPLVLEDRFGRTVTIDAVEVLARADTVEGLPEGQMLIAVHCQGNDVAELGYDTFEESPLGDVYLYCDGTYRTSVSSYYFDDGYMDVIGNRQDIGSYEFMYGSAVSGYWFYFVPGDATEMQLMLQVNDTDTGEQIGYYCVPLALDASDDMQGMQ